MGCLNAKLRWPSSKKKLLYGICTARTQVAHGLKTSVQTQTQSQVSPSRTLKIFAAWCCLNSSTVRIKISMNIWNWLVWVFKSQPHDYKMPASLEGLYISVLCVLLGPLVCTWLLLDRVLNLRMSSVVDLIQNKCRLWRTIPGWTFIERIWKVQDSEKPIINRPSIDHV